MSHNFGKPCPAEDLHFHMVCGHRDMNGGAQGVDARWEGIITKSKCTI